MFLSHPLNGVLFHTEPFSVTAYSPPVMENSCFTCAYTENKGTELMKMRTFALQVRGSLCELCNSAWEHPY